MGKKLGRMDPLHVRGLEDKSSTDEKVDHGAFKRVTRLALMYVIYC